MNMMRIGEYNLGVVVPSGCEPATEFYSQLAMISCILTNGNIFINGTYTEFDYSSRVIAFRTQLVRYSAIIEYPGFSPFQSFSFSQIGRRKLFAFSVFLTRRLDETLQRNICRKATWDGRDSECSSFTPVSYKRD